MSACEGPFDRNSEHQCAYRHLCRSRRWSMKKIIGGTRTTWNQESIVLDYFRLAHRIALLRKKMRTYFSCLIFDVETSEQFCETQWQTPPLPLRLAAPHVACRMPRLAAVVAMIPTIVTETVRRRFGRNTRRNVFFRVPLAPAVFNPVSKGRRVTFLIQNISCKIVEVCMGAVACHKATPVEAARGPLRSRSRRQTVA
jgi:hypothetical protein